MASTIRIVSRSSPMALAQVERVRGLLHREHPGLVTQVVPVTTSGDRWQGALSQLGGKGAFTKEVDAALLSGEADLAVHCLKDMPGDRPLPEGTTVAAYLERDDIRDAVVLPEGHTPLTLDELPHGAKVGTSSVRRVAQLADSHPWLECTPIRGNANSRLAKLDAGEFDALILAVSGLHRIGLEERISQILDVDAMCPPIGAGILALQCRVDDTDTIDAIGPLNHVPTWREAHAERMMLHALQGHCNSPIAGYAACAADGSLSLRAKVFTPDGKKVVNAHEWAGALTPDELGMATALALLRQGARELIDQIPH
ncbi:hydroxymethylbilane synthase [Streptacidiphilus fuscans]|uniref:Porphobilinogen deaminase n=1 Tax=Streptacidiphilus fuscans TaxID=2789292 RepID=A0A931B1M4_9ACTN|nr:hydroxymethylbilane synthase [Streptacidiphilus fuscans]MBF9068593.1 hydroxymethylbilane synthase [Streptacidiphilus fuscans]